MVIAKAYRTRTDDRQQDWLQKLQRQHCNVLQEADPPIPIAHP